MRTMTMAALMLASPALAQQAGPALPGTSGPATTTAAQRGPVPQRAPIGGVLILYGNERCPTDAEGNEVIVCEHRSASEQFRVPKELREFEVTPENRSWARQAQGTLVAGEGNNTIGTCSTVGVGGASGCFLQQSRTNRATNQARAAEEKRTP